MTHPAPTTSILAVVARFYWMILGPLLLIIPTVNILGKGGGWFTAADVAFLALVGGCSSPVALSFGQVIRGHAWTNRRHQPIFAGMRWGQPLWG